MRILHFLIPFFVLSSVSFAQIKITELPQISDPAPNDVFPIVDVSDSPQRTKKVSLSQILDKVSAPVTSVNGKTGNVIILKSDLGLSNVDNTSDLNKPISTATQAALDLKANINSPNLTGVPTAPTASPGTNTTQLATTEFVTDAVLSATIPDATTTTKGKVQLAGDLSGTADAPTVPGLTTKANQTDLDATDARVDDIELVQTDHEVRISGNELNISDIQSDVSTLQTGLSTKANDADVVHKAGDETITGNKYFTGRISTASTTAGNKICPEMTNTQMEAVTTPQNGDCVYNTDKKAPFFYSSVDSKWKQAGGGTASLELQSDPSFESGIGDGVVSGTFTASRVSASDELGTPTNESMLQLQMGVGTSSYTVTKTLTDGQRGQPVFFGIWFKRLLAATCSVSAMVDGAVIYGSTKTVNTSSRWDFHYYPFTAGQISVGYKFECTAALVDVAWLDQSKLVINDNSAPIVNNVLNVTQSSTLFKSASLAAGASLSGALTTSKGSGCYTYNTTSGVYSVIKECSFNIAGSMSTAGSSTIEPVLIYNGSIRSRATSAALVDTGGTISFNIVAEIGDTFSFRNDRNTSNNQEFTVVATASNPNAIFNNQTVSTDFTPMFFKSTQCLETEIGCFNTYQYDGNPTPSNNKSLCTTAPTQVVSDFLTNGILLYSRPYNADSSCAQPARFEIVIGKNMKTPQPITLYKNSGKMISGDIDFFQSGADTIARGIRIKSYDSTTGILTLDAGFNSTAITSAAFDFNDNTSSSSGYVVLNFSKNPAVSGIDINSINQFAYIKDVKANGTDGGSSVSAAWTNRVLNTLDNPNGIVKSLSSNQFTLGPGTYRIVAESPLFHAAGSYTGRIRLRNVTDNVTTLTSVSAPLSVGSNDGQTTIYPLRGRFTINKDTTFAIQYRMSVGRATNGLGMASDSGESEVYTQVEIQKVSP